MEPNSVITCIRNRAQFKAEWSFPAPDICIAICEVVPVSGRIVQCDVRYQKIQSRNGDSLTCWCCVCQLIVCQWVSREIWLDEDGYIGSQADAPGSTQDPNYKRQQCALHDSAF